MRRWHMWTTWMSVVTVAGTLSGCSSNQTPVATTIPSNAQKVNVAATDFKWTLDKTTFQAGHPIDFIVHSDTSVHGFSIVQTNVSHTVSQGDKPIQIVWTPPASGQYTIRCNQMCGSGHDNMFTSFTVN